MEWLRDIEGPRLIKRLVDEVHAHDVGKMTPTGARCAAMLLDRALPTLSAVHHTVEGQLSSMSTDEILAELKRIASQPGQILEVQDVTPREVEETQSEENPEQE